MRIIILSLILYFSGPHLYAGKTALSRLKNKPDSTILVCEYKDCKLYISSSAKYKDQFVPLLKSDTILANYFKPLFQEPVSIEIRSIETDPAVNESYIFTIFAYPQNISETDKLNRVLLGAGRMKYRVSTKPDYIPTRRKIVKIEPGENLIEM